MTEAARSAELIRKAIVDPTKPFTVADASVASGVALRDAEAGLHVLTSEYRGHLRVSEDGDLVHVFPNGFTKPWETKERFERVVEKLTGALLGVGRFVVRAWLLVVMIAYAVLFIALLVGLMFAGRSNDRDSGGSQIGALIGTLLRVIADAFWWTWHPFSPLYVEAPIAYDRRERERDPTPFYEKVNRFVFGPTTAPTDPEAMRARVLSEIRLRKGRIGLADVMRVTGLPRDQADPLMAKLMLDYEGEVDVAEQGGIVYRFEAIRRTAGETATGDRPARPAWETPPTVPPLTGNTTPANVGIAALNVFNALAAAFVLENGWTITNIIHLFEKRPRGVPPIFEPGTPIALGIVPLVFSIAVLLLPAIRAAFRARKEKKIAEERARLAILREVLARAPKKEPVPDETLKTAWRVATGEEPTSKEITKRVVELGGDVDVGPEGEVRYRFADLEAEAEALEEERAQAAESEARLGKIVFTSES